MRCSGRNRFARVVRALTESAECGRLAGLIYVCFIKPMAMTNPFGEGTACES